jgi:hypothetical protein
MYTGTYKNKGCASKFYKLTNKNRGFKEFNSKRDADIAHYNQNVLSQYDLAPRVYSEVGRIRIGRNKRLSKWGYITEVAITLGCGGNDCDCCDRDELEREYGEMIVDLCDKIDGIGFYFSDCHSGNVGFVKRHGRPVMVCIDTGDESITGDKCFCIICENGGNCCG